jgi:hypothetical protein
MQKAQSSLDARKEQSAGFTVAQAAFGDILERNLAKSLVESGRCREAEPHLRATIGSWPYAKEALSKPCNDIESGLQYCFEKSSYCRK